MNQGLRAVSSAVPTIARVTVSLLVSVFPSGRVPYLFFTIKSGIRGCPFMVFSILISPLSAGSSGSRYFSRSFSGSVSFFLSSPTAISITRPIIILIPIIMAYGSLARMLEPLCVIIRLVSRVLVHGLLVIMVVLTIWLLVLAHWWLWVLGIGLLVELSRKLWRWVLVWGLWIVLVIFILVVSLNAIFRLVSKIFVFVFLFWFYIF